MGKQLITFAQNGPSLLPSQDIDSPMGGMYLPNIKYYEMRSVRNFGGASIRIFKGFRIGGGQSKGHEELTLIDEGYLDFSKKNITFCGHSNTISFPLNKVARFQPYTDGIGIYKDGRIKEYRFAWGKDINMKLVGVTSDNGKVKPLSGGLISKVLDALKNNA
jgi:hypothetical protein